MCALVDRQWRHHGEICGRIHDSAAHAHEHRKPDTAGERCICRKRRQQPDSNEKQRPADEALHVISIETCYARAGEDNNGAERHAEPEGVNSRVDGRGKLASLIVSREVVNHGEHHNGVGKGL